MSNRDVGSSTGQQVGAPEPFTRPTPAAPLTGVARGALGTATNLDDTQVFLLDELHAPPVAPPVAPPASLPVARPAAVRVARAPARRMEPAAVRPEAGARRAGPILAAGLAIAALVAVLALQGGGSPDVGTLGGGGVTSDQGAATTPLATTAPAPTAEQNASGKGGGGNGNGRGNGGGGKPR